MQLEDGFYDTTYGLFDSGFVSDTDYGLGISDPAARLAPRADAEDALEGGAPLSRRRPHVAGCSAEERMRAPDVARV